VSSAFQLFRIGSKIILLQLCNPAVHSLLELHFLRILNREIADQTLEPEGRIQSLEGRIHLGRTDTNIGMKGIQTLGERMQTFEGRIQTM